MRLFHSLGHVFGGTLLIAGTTIGVGMLALPIATAPGGFIPASTIYLLCWIFMLSTGLLLLEVCSWMPKDANFITMTERLLGPWGKLICWIVYLFLFVTVMIAHVASGGDVLKELAGLDISPSASMVLYVLLFSPVVYLGTRSVDRLNMLLILGTVVTYILFISTSIQHVNPELLKFQNWPKAWLALPVLFAAFTYQLIVPTLVTYMEGNVKKVRLSIILGTSIPLVVYLIWEFLILSIVPVEGAGGLLEAGQKGQTAIMPLKGFLDNSNLFLIGKYFAFFTLTTSYVALALAFLDFLADGLKMRKKGLKKVFLCLLIFVPPTLIALTYPDIFIRALSYAGGISCAVLFGIFPPLMVWMGRYRKKYPQTPAPFPGGRFVLSLLMAFVVFELGIEAAQIFGLV
jgi:tyrosine-specific transport protein